MTVDPSSGGDPPSARPASPLPVNGAAAWRPWATAVACIGAFGLALAGRAVVTAVAGESDVVLLGGAIVLILLSISSIAMAVLLASMHGRPTAADFGLRRPPIGRAIALTLVLWITLTGLTVLWISALRLDGEGGRALTDRLGTDGTVAVVILIVVLTVIAPIEEEFLFRGYIFRALKNWRGVWPAAGMTGVLFAGPMSDGCRSRLWYSSSRSALGCACSTAGPGRCIRESLSTLSTTRSPSPPR